MPKASAAPVVADEVNATSVPAFYNPPSPLPKAPPGTLIRYELVTGVPGVPPGATVWRILYHSTTIYGGDIAESGYVVTPRGPAPAGGWPMIAWAHGTSGFGRLCAPSLFSRREGDGLYLIPGLATFLRAGLAIAATDYQGLGAPGIHGYLLGSSEGRGALDAALAARNLPGHHINRTVIIYGHSQGGQAALFAGEMAPAYAPDLHVIGVVAAAPATTLTAIMDAALSPSGQGILDYSLPAAWSWTQIYRDLPISDLFTTYGARVAGPTVTTGCQGTELAAIRARHLIAASLFKRDAYSNPVVVAHAELNNPGRVRTDAPMLVVQGTADGTVPQGLTDYFVNKAACPIGDTIEYLHVTGATHGTVVYVAIPTILRWMKARLRGASPPSTCGRPGDFAVLSP
ncbi:MAG: lipase family protein [Acidimicrobiales bacterium]